MEQLGIGARVNHPKFGEGIVTQMGVSTISIFFRNHGDKELSREFAGLEVVFPAETAYNGLSLEEVKAALTSVLETYSDISGVVHLGDRWKGGKMILQPEDPALQAKEIPMETFFHKIVMVRDRLRVMEQQINAHDKLTDEEKINLQQYITRIYGSLTTFNILFKNKEMYFYGDGKKNEA